MHRSFASIAAVHITLEDLLPPTTYFRFNPNLSIDVPIDESGPAVLKQLVTDARNYIDKYDWKYRKASESLMKKKTHYQRARDLLGMEMLMRK